MYWNTGYSFQKDISKLKKFEIKLYSIVLSGWISSQIFWGWRWTSSKRISTYKRDSDFFWNFLGIVWKFFGNGLGILREFFGNSFGFFGIYGWEVLIWDFFEKFSRILWEFYRNSLRILNCILTQSCQCDMKWCNFWLNEEGRKI